MPSRREPLDTRELAAVFAGGAGGALLRVLLNRAFGGGAPSWPWATFAINVTGSLALAYLATRLEERLPPSSYRRPLLATGFCGAYTTFSTIQIEVLTIFDHHLYALAVGYGLASIISGYLAVWLATAVARRTRLIT